MSSSSAIEDFWNDDFAPLAHAGKVILKELREDESAPDADIYRRILSSGEGSHLYFLDDTVKHEKSVPLPEFIVKEAKTVRASSRMGLFPKANLAWMVVDHKLYLWPFEDDTDDICRVSIPSERPIASVGLVKPKKGVFKSVVEWCLVVSTPDEVMLCALTRQDGVLRLIPTRYSLATDEAPVISICGTPEGRIFLGGQDGALYEMDYEGMVAKGGGTRMTGEQRLKSYFDCGAPISVLKPQRENDTIAGQVLSSGKRVFSSLFVADAERERPRKCRKLNHSSSIVADIGRAVVADWLRKASTTLIGGDPVRNGPLTQVAYDSERKRIYTLTQRGYLTVFDLKKDLQAVSGLDTEKTARIYLSAVARGQIYPSHSKISFPGGGASAQAGVGGMDGARSIIKLADSSPNLDHGVLTPVSLHVLSGHESQKLDLLIVTEGGLRYYLSTLPSIGTMPGSRSLAPSSSIKLTLCYIRAPPCVDLPNGRLCSATYDSFELGGLMPKVTKGAVVDAVGYHCGMSMLALSEAPSKGHSRAAPVGSLLMVTAPDSLKRKAIRNDSVVIRETVGGMSETVSVPTDDSSQVVLPGGPVLDVGVLESKQCMILNLMLQSQTPTDSELTVIVPPYLPKVAGEDKEQASPKQSAVKSSPGAVRPNGRMLVRTSGARASTSSIALTVVSNLLLARPLSHGLRYQAPTNRSDEANQNRQIYKISSRHGTSVGGFSGTASGKVGRNSNVSIPVSTASHKSVRLSPWLLHPKEIALSEVALQHLLQSQRQIVTVNREGIHFFARRSLLMKLADTLMSLGATNDEHLTTFFESFGYKQGCAMCLSLAIRCGPASGSGSYHEDLGHRACHAALRHALVPRLHRKVKVLESAVIVEETATDTLVPKGYEFVCSSLYDGVASLLSRLLRPIWFKPAVVVTEMQTVQRRGSKSTITYPAKVELLLDSASLEEIRRPLTRLREVMTKLFPPAIVVVPGGKPLSNDTMEIDTITGGAVWTGGMQFQNSLREQNASNTLLSPREAEMIAHLIEERNIHSLYRLLSRTVQLLKLLSLLELAQTMPDLPEVDWGLLHGMQVSQLVQMKEGQERMETLLNSLVSSHKGQRGGSVAQSADCDRLASQLASDCYLYFSPGSRFGYLGFRTANEALSCPKSSPRRAALAGQAVSHFKRAAVFWNSAAMISGRTIRSSEEESHNQRASRALQFDSPLARAATLLMELDEAIALVELCLITSANFGGNESRRELLRNGDYNSESGSQFPWERGLYHVKREPASSYSSASPVSKSSAIIIGNNVTPKDAVLTCYSIALHHLSRALESNRKALAGNIIQACVTSTDSNFKTSMFEHLLATNHIECILKIESNDVEHWMKSTNKDTDLLWRFYMVQNKPDLAGRLLWLIGTDTKKSLPIKDRIECLGKALSSFNAGLAAGPQRFQITGEEMKRLVVEVRETLEVATIQQRTLQTVMSMSLETKLDDALVERLKSSLVPVSDLYNIYAAPLNLFEICLSILHSCRHNDPGVIETLWKSILCEELMPCSTRSEQAFNVIKSFMSGSMVEESIDLLDENTESSYSSPLFEGGAWLDRLKHRLVGLGKELFGRGADYVFPVDFLAASMEGLRIAQFIAQSQSGGRSDSAWPILTLVEIGVPFPTILAAYRGILENEERATMGRASPQTRLWNVKGVVEVMEEWLVRATRGTRAIDQLNEIMAGGKLLSHIDRYKASLDELSLPEVEDLRGRLKLIEATLRRVVQRR